MVIPDVARGRDDRQRDDERADPMGEVDRDLRIPVIGHELAEHQREIGNREAGIGVPHRRADQNLHVDQAPWSPSRPAAARGIVDAAIAVGS